MNDWFFALPNGIVIFLVVILLIGWTNVFALRRLENFGAPAQFPRVAILVPARNEAHNIRACIESLLAQDYTNFEIVALDDHSTDDTLAILNECASNASRLRVLQGEPLPAGWLGKHWACHQLARAADAELILFTDADTVHHPLALRNAVAALLQQDAALVTALPRERVVTWGERLIVPLLPWSIFHFLPLALAHRMQTPALSATIGQFMLYRRVAYDAIGGHASVRAHIADDLALGRGVIARGFKWQLVDGNARVECRMYRSGRHALDGFSKNLFAAFDYHAWLFVPIWLWLGVVFLAPLPLALMGNMRALVAVGLALLLWGSCYVRFRVPPYLAFFYPATIGLAVYIAFCSLTLTRARRAMWKGRVLSAE